ncbi:hypothetical protein Kpol_1031p55 [Vanderwaltozyma polyspora DSM 70294]|uniref:Cytochrome c oxidase assembly protein COX20, mitochondrial n=1 Tax=Vanderwaltozyma polyspora (strain ATCC 22028 / DSM 70294 / BCRC 21397 / CBS 2163 / NBRC 10782 / NRRL Y-8283 / UCD 57-17) TaxID=436907 RepID=A7THY6_VANPO|nr:uncharacterized protein Kpol_1031p55 [Vanderwaltozyma polyspora DSM 70294]EDO18148.1 hypothetical protein Kpol_1031p55 [Vanderwaltozyma polyspora DSM 70294]
MGWWGSSKKESADSNENTNSLMDNKKIPIDNDETPITNYTRGQKILLEDTRPKFKGELSQSQLAHQNEQNQLKQAWDSVSMTDFSFEKLTSIPCFRDAGMMGFSSLFVVGSIIFLYHKNPTKATNWGVGSFLLGSIVGWEQCRAKRRRSFQNAQRAKETMAKKERPMLNKVQHDERLVNQWDKSKINDSTKPSPTNEGKPWYKFW